MGTSPGLVPRAGKRRRHLVGPTPADRARLRECLLTIAANLRPDEPPGALLVR